MFAAYNYGGKRIVETLVAHNCKLDLQNEVGRTAVMMAARGNHKEIVEVLVAHKCDLDSEDCEGFTALAYAQLCKYVETFELIENQLRRNRNWEHRKALMLVLAGSTNLLPSSSSIISPAAAVVGPGRAVQTPGAIQRADAALTSSEKVLCDLFLVQHIMRYI